MNWTSKFKAKNCGEPPEGEFNFRFKLASPKFIIYCTRNWPINWSLLFTTVDDKRYTGVSG